MCNNVYTDSLHPALSSHLKMRTTNQLLKVNFKYLYNKKRFIKFNARGVL